MFRPDHKSALDRHAETMRDRSKHNWEHASTAVALKRLRQAEPTPEPCEVECALWDLHLSSIALFGPDPCVRSSLDPDVLGRYALSEHGGTAYPF